MAADRAASLKDASIVQQKPFGRRAGPPRARAPVSGEACVAPARPLPAFAEAPARNSPALDAPAFPAHDHELAARKKARRRDFKIPWRQLSLMASLCFGIASLVLPDTVNDGVNWLLYALMAGSFYAGISGRWRKS